MLNTCFLFILIAYRLFIQVDHCGIDIAVLKRHFVILFAAAVPVIIHFMCICFLLSVFIKILLRLLKPHGYSSAVALILNQYLHPHTALSFCFFFYASMVEPVSLVSLLAAKMFD